MYHTLRCRSSAPPPHENKPFYRRAHLSAHHTHPPAPPPALRSGSPPLLDHPDILFHHSAHGANGRSGTPLSSAAHPHTSEDSQACPHRSLYVFP